MQNFDIGFTRAISAEAAMDGGSFLGGAAMADGGNTKREFSGEKKRSSDI